jgi:Zn-dependent protease
MLLTTGMLFGGGKPVPVQPDEFRHPARGFMYVALAGPATNLLLAAGFVVAFAILAWTGVFEATVITDSYAAEGHRVFLPTLESVANQGFLGAFIAWGVTLNVLLAVFNLIPLPPLDGSRVVGWILPEALQRHWYRLDRFGMLLLLVFFFAPGRYGMKLVWAIFQPVREAYLEAAAQLVSMVPV